MSALKNSTRREAGIALLTTILLLMLMSSLLVGFIILVTSTQRLSGMNNDYSRAFYGAEAGMEKLTADLGTLFNNTYAPSGAQVNALMTTPPSLTGIAYVDPVAPSGYSITYPTDASGNPKASIITIQSGPYQGMTALATPYAMTVTAHTRAGSEVKLTRTTQTVGIPMFQFGVFSQTDLSFFPGPDFNFGGRTQTNGNLYLAAGNNVWLSDKVTAYGDVIRTNLSNGWPVGTGYTGTVNVTISPGSASYRAMATTEGSLTGTVGSAPNTSPVPWNTISLGTSYYAGNIRNGAFGAARGTGAKRLDLAIVTLGNGVTQTVDLIRRPVQNEGAGILGERFFAQASFRILLSDNSNDIMQLPCIDTTVQPFNLADIAGPVAAWATARATALGAAMTAAGTTRVPLATSGGAVALPGGPGYSAANGYWQPKNTAIITGFIKIEIQRPPYGSPCGADWKDVTQEVLSFGYAGRNNNPVAAPTNSAASSPLPALPAPAVAVEVPPSVCLDPHPNAIIRLERVRDNPSNTAAVGACGVTSVAGVVTAPPLGSDYWPNVLFDTREGTIRDVCPDGTSPCTYTQVRLGGVMHYVELDARNLGRWLTGLIGASGTQAKDPAIAPNNFAVYISDRRGNFVPAALPIPWPPASPSTNETGEYGFQDFVNPLSANACPNGTLDTGEDLDGLGTTVPLFTYGQVTTPSVLNTFFSDAINATAPDPNCAVAAPSSVWPGTYLVNSNEARENPSAFFRRAVKIVNGNLLNLGNCPGAVPCGLTIAMENPVYVNGDYNANSAGGGWNDPQVAAAVLADAFTFLSGNWNDVNSFIFPYAHSGTKRNGATTWYRLGIVAGKGVSFPQPGGYATNQDFGTDGGVHNFLRYVEDWGGQTLNYRGSILSLYYNRQATGLYKCCTTVYSPPSRGYNFDTNFLTPSLLPPRTPMFRDVNTTGFSQLIQAAQ